MSCIIGRSLFILKWLRMLTTVVSCMLRCLFSNRFVFFIRIVTFGPLVAAFVDGAMIIFVAEVVVLP